MNYCLMNVYIFVNLGKFSCRCNDEMQRYLTTARKLVVCLFSLFVTKVLVK
jgi:hypothetical protein